MTRARKSIIDLEATPYYHVISRCVRRAYLCGEDEVSGKNFEHRRQWIEDRIKFLASVFAIDICAFAIMQNHYHIVLKVQTHQTKEWTELEVIERWRSLYNADSVLVDLYLNDEAIGAQISEAKKIISGWRTNLSSISWFMKNTNQYIACMANKEDGSTGHFWQSRFKSQALLDEAALLSCMAYVDLNPIRAGIATNLDDSDFTSIQERVKTLADAQEQLRLSKGKGRGKGKIHPLPYQPEALLDFGSQPDKDAIHFTLSDYLELVDWTGRRIRDDKKGFINSLAPKLFVQLKMDEEDWFDMTQSFERKFAYFAAKPELLYFHAEEHGAHYYQGVG